MKAWPRSALLAYTALFLGILIALSGEPIFGGKGALTLELSDARGRYFLGLFTDYLEDPTGDLTLSDVVLPEYQGRFTPGRQQTLNFGMTRSPHWFRVRLRNNTAKTEAWLLEVAPPYLDAVDVYLPQPDGRIEHAHVGDLLPFDQRAIAYRHFLIPLPLAVATDQTLYLRLENKDNLLASVTLWEPTAFVQHQQLQAMEMGLLFGGLLILSVYHLLLFVTVRERLYLYFTLYALIHLFVFIAKSGLGYQYLWPRSVRWQNIAVLSLQALATLAHLLFTVTFLRLREHSPFLKRLLYAGSILIVILLLGWTFTEAPSFRRLSIALSTPTVMILLGVGVYTWRRGEVMARYYLMIWGSYALSALIYILMLLNVLPLSPLMMHADEYGFLAMLVLLSLSLADRINLTKREKKTAQARALALAQENEQLVREQNVHLEEEVEARTAELSESEERFRAVTDSMEALIYVADMKTHEILFVNEYTRRLFGEVTGQICWQALQEGRTEPCSFCTNDSLVQDGEPAGIVTWEFQNTNTGRWYHIQDQAIRWHDGRLVRLEVATDISKVKEAEAQKQRLAAVEERERIGRELHDDLGQVVGYINVQAQTALALLKQDQLPQAHAALNQLVRVAEEAQGNVRQHILGIRQTPSTPSPNFFNTLQGYLSKLQARYGLRVHLQRPFDWPTSPFAPEVEIQILRIVQEALTNVAKHAGVRKAWVRFEPVGSQARVTVEDHGMGMPSSDPRAAGGQQGEQARRGTAERTPPPDRHFGLHMMRERAQSVGGSLRVETVPESGTRILLDVPLALERPTPSGGRDWRRLRVMLVDDHRLFLEGLKNMLSAHGIQVVGTAHDGLEAQALVEEVRPDVVLMDVEMPGCDGVEATRAITSRYPEVKVVMLTVYVDNEVLFRALKAGASGYLLKSLDSETLFSLLSNLLQGEVVIAPELAARVLNELAADQLQATSQTAHTEIMEERPAPPPSQGSLTPRQIEVLQAVARGLTYKEVGQQLYISERTVKYHMGQILERLQFQSRAQAIAYATQEGLLDLDTEQE
jgi:PAS domain S-box-containing protein